MNKTPRKPGEHPVAASPWLFGASAILLALFIALVLPGQSAGASRFTPEGASFDTSFFYTPEQAFAKAAAYSAEGRFEYIRARWSFDLAWPLVYGLFAFTGCAFGLRRLGAGPADRWRLSFLALLGPALDFVENIAATVIMASVPAQPLGWGIAASAATPLKWLFVSVGMAGAVILPVAAAILSARRGLR
jgi:hypothetical protein